MSATIYPILPVVLMDDEIQALNSFETVLHSARINNCLRLQDSRELLPTLSRQEVEVILLDLRMPHISGHQLLPAMTHDYPEIPVIVITAADDVETAVNCMQSGAFDYLVKPVEKNRLIACVSRAIEIRELQRENMRLRAHVLFDKLEHPEAFSDIVTNSNLMRSVFQYVEAIAVSSQAVMIDGETGVGKELIARSIHALSKRTGEFVSVNLSGLDENIFSDTLFGHKKGAYTGADAARRGLVEKAAGGTLFLDEIGDLDGNMQVKLLRLLQEGEYLPLGSDIAKRSDARILVATNKDLQALRESGEFRKDLYFRLCSHHVHLPPLRERLEDLPLLVEHFLEMAAADLEKKKPTPPEELIDLLSSYHFPGNVRELRSMVWDAVSNHKFGKLSLNVFKKHIRSSGAFGDPESDIPKTFQHNLITFGDRLPTFKQAENLLIDEAMRRSGANQAVAAMHLGISRQALNRRIRQKKKNSPL